MNSRRNWAYALLVLTLLGLSACGPGFGSSDLASKIEKNVGAGQPTVPALPGEKACSTAALFSSGGRRMNSREFINSVTQLLGSVAIQREELPVDSKNSADFDNDGSGLHILDYDADKYYAVIARVVSETFAVGNRPAFVTCDLDTATGGVSPQQCLDQSLRKLLARAFKKTPSAELLAKFTALTQSEGNPRLKLKLATQAALLSKDFLYVNINAGQTVGALNKLTNDQLAERLALFLWASVPDEALMAAAQANQLSTKEGLRAQIERMIQDARFDGFIKGFFDQWLKLDGLADETRSTALFPNFTPELLTSMGTETHLFLNDIIRSQRPIEDMFTASYSFVDQRLAEHYGIGGVGGAEFQRVTLPSGQRKGLLTQASILTVTGRDSHETAPVRRGVFVLKKLTCTPLGSPPKDIPSFPADPPTGAEVTARVKLDAHRANPVCAGCHAVIDPPGLALENFDNLGRWRTNYSPTLAVDSAGSIGGVSFNNPAGLVQALATDQFKSCMAQNVATYALGRVTDNKDKCHSDNAVIRAARGAGSFADLMVELVSSELFQKEIGE